MMIIIRCLLIIISFLGGVFVFREIFDRELDLALIGGCIGCH